MPDSSYQESQNQRQQRASCCSVELYRRASLGRILLRRATASQSHRTHRRPNLKVLGSFIAAHSSGADCHQHMLTDRQMTRNEWSILPYRQQGQLHKGSAPELPGHALCNAHGIHIYFTKRRGVGKMNRERKIRHPESLWLRAQCFF